MATFSTVRKRIPDKVVSEPTFTGGTLTVKEGIRLVKEGIRAFHLQSNLLEKRLDSLNEEFEVRMTKLEEKLDAMMSILQQSNPQLLIVPQIPIIHPQPSNPQPHTAPLISTSPLSSIAPQQIEKREVTNPNTNSLNSKGCCDGENVFRAQIKDGVVVNGEDLSSFEAKVKSVEKNGDETSKVFVEMHKQEKEEKLMIEVSTIFTSIPDHQPSVCGNVSKAYVPYLELRLSVRRKVKKTKLNVLMLDLKAIIGNAKLVLNGWHPPMKEKVVELNFLQPLKFGSFVIRTNNCELTDVIFDVSGEKFHAQKLVLAARALLYKALFFDGADGGLLILSDAGAALDALKTAQSLLKKGGEEVTVELLNNIGVLYFERGEFELDEQAFKDALGDGIWVSFLSARIDNSAINSSSFSFQYRGFVVDLVTITSLLIGLHKSGRWNCAERLVKYVRDKALLPNVLRWKVEMDSSLRSPQDKGKDFTPLFPSVGNLCDIMSLIDPFPGKDDEDIISLHEEMKDEWSSSPYLDQLVKKFENLDDSPQVFSVSKGQRVQDRGAESFDVDMVNTYLSIFLSKGKLSVACKLFEIFSSFGKEPGSYSYNALMSSFVKRGNVPDTYCYNTLIKGFCDAGRLDQVGSLRLEISKNGLFPDSTTYTIMICRLCKNGLILDAEKIFEEMEKVGCVPTVMTFNALINGLCKAGDLKKALLHLCEMEMGRKPSLFLRLSQGVNRINDPQALQKRVEEMCEAGDVVKAYKLLRDIIDSGMDADVVTYNTLMSGLLKARDPEGALNLYKGLQFKGLSLEEVTFGTLIDGLLKIHRDKDADIVYQHMVKNGHSPSLSICNSLMVAHCRRNFLSVSLGTSSFLRGLELSGTPAVPASPESSAD